MTLLREIQLLLERTYAPIPVNLETCLISEHRCAALTRLAGGDAARLAPGGRTFLRPVGDTLALAIFFAPPVIARLEADDPRRTINERNIAALIIFIEEIAHGVQAALLFLEGERALDGEDFARNLEAQARIDTYLVLSRLTQLLGGGRIPRRCGPWLRRQLFDNSHRRMASPRLRARYRAAQHCARRFLAHLRHVPLNERADELRAFRALSWSGKQAYLRPRSRRQSRVLQR